MTASPASPGPERTVMILGATTPLGRALARQLLTEPWLKSLIAVGRDPEEALAISSDPKLCYRQVDLTRPRQMHDLLFGDVIARETEVLVHLAMHRDFVPDESSHTQNVEPLRWVLSAAERHPRLRRVVLRSCADVYQVKGNLPSLLSEEHPLNLSAGAPAWQLERVEADLLACAQMGMGKTEIVVLRLGELLAADCGSQLYDYLQSTICLRPLGFDPMLNLLSIEDAVDAFARAIAATQLQGVFNIPGADTLPLSDCIYHAGKYAVPLPGPLLEPGYRLRRLFGEGRFSYRLNEHRFHYASVLAGNKARMTLGYQPRHPIAWPLRSSVVEHALHSRRKLLDTQALRLRKND